MIRATAGEIASMLRGTPLVIMLDIDGTLCDLVVDADAAIVPDATRAALRLLREHQDDGVHVALVTGRSVADARRMVGIDGISIYGNHGMERLLEDGSIHGPTDFDDADFASIHAAVVDLTGLTRKFPGTGVEDKRLSLSIHYRGMDQSLATAFTREVLAIVHRHGLRASPGKCVINVVPPHARNKGDAVREILAESGGHSPTASILFAGDDVTDEDAFVALRSVPGAISVRVGETTGPSAAAYLVDDCIAVQQLLQKIVQERA